MNTPHGTTPSNIRTNKATSTQEYSHSTFETIKVPERPPNRPLVLGKGLLTPALWPPALLAVVSLGSTSTICPFTMIRFIIIILIDMQSAIRCLSSCFNC